MATQLPAFDSLEEISTQLNEASDSVNEILEGFEERLNSLNLGIEVWLGERAIDVWGREGDTDRSTEHHAYLGYARLVNGWGLAIKTVRVENGLFEGDPSCPYSDTFDEGQPIPVQRASRDYRLKAVTLLPELLEVIAGRGKQLLNEIADSQVKLKKQ